MYNILSLDLSEKRCGIAIYFVNENKIKSQKVIFIESENKLLTEIENIIMENEIGFIVIGISLRQNGTVSSRFHYIKHFAHRLFQKNKTKYTLFNEFQSSKQAKQISKKTHIDSIAASVILKKYLLQNPF